MDTSVIAQRTDEFCFSNAAMFKLPPKGILIRFRGMTLDIPMVELIREGRKYAKAGILYVYPYTAPWAWMNDDTVDMVDAILDDLRGKTGLTQRVPVVYYGYSMGGYSALMYGVYGKYKPTAVAAVCPVCDLVFHKTEHLGLFVSFYYAFSRISDQVDELITVRSPIHAIAHMPLVPYLFVCCDHDRIVHSENHGIAMAGKMRASGFDVTLIRENGEHCQISRETEDTVSVFILSAMEEKPHEQ